VVGMSLYFAILSAGSAVVAAFLIGVLIAWLLFIKRERRR